MAGTKVDTKPDLPSDGVKVDTLTPKELAEMQKALAQRQMQMGPHAIDTVLEQTVARTNDQRQEQQLYASTWAGMAGVVAALVKVSDYERDQSRRKALEAIQNEMFELLAKEKKKDALRGSPFFQQLVSILGKDTAESITQKLEAAGAGGLQANQAALAQAAKDIAAILEKNRAVLGLGVTGEALAKTLEGEMAVAVAKIQKSAPQLSVVKQSDTLATQTHEQMKSLERGDERLARLQTIRSELGPEKFSAMIDAYDKRYGVPLITHIANLSTTNPALQGQIRHETLALLSPEQRQRVTDFARAEYAQTMALLDAQREAARDALGPVTQEMRATEKVLAKELGKPELATLPEGEIRAKLLEALSSRLPELKGMSWEASYLRLKEVAGQTNDESLATALRSINGGTDPQDLAALREYIARATLQMQKLATLDQQLEGYKNLLSTTETSDEGRLRKYYSLAYGAEVTTRDATYEATKKAAGAYIDTLHHRISDPSLGVEERANLIRERDAIEFSAVKKLAADALHGGEKPNEQLALGILKNFGVSYGDTPARRGDAYRTVCEHLITSIESAQSLHQEWVGLDVAQFRLVDLNGPKVTGTVSCLTGKPVGNQELDLRQRFSELGGTTSKAGASDEALKQFIAQVAKGEKGNAQAPKTSHQDVLEAQREAAISTNFFAHILDGEVPYRSVQAPSLSLEDSYGTAKALATHDRIVTVTRTLDEVSAKLPRELRDLEAQSSSSFLATSMQRAVAEGLDGKTCAKLGVASGAEGVSKVLSELDPRKGVTLDASLSKIETLLGALSDEEHQEFLRFFETTTRRSLGQALIANLPIDQSRQEILVRLAGSRSVEGRDLQRFYGEPVPNDVKARVEMLSRAIQADTQRQPIKRTNVEDAARVAARQYGTLREAAMIAMRQGDVALVGEITEKMRAFEARLSGTITRAVAQTDASSLARTGEREYLQALQEHTLEEEYRTYTTARTTVAALAKDVAALLRSETPKTDAAFNRVRQANLSEEQTLLLRAVYSQEAQRRSPDLAQRALTGVLERDLQATTSLRAEERERIGLLIKGGPEALQEVDRKTLAMAVREQNEKRQLETLSNLRATGQYEAMKGQLSAMKLTPGAQAYRKALESGDTTKADAADLSIKAKNGDVKPSEVAAFLKDKSPEDVARVTKEYPTLTQDLAKANPFFNEENTKLLMSNVAADRQRALEQAMLKSLTSPEDFEAWLKVEPVLMQRWVMLNNLEELLEKQNPKPTFVANGESKIVQYVRAQKTDLREIDAELIKSIIHETRGLKQSSSSATLEHLKALREQAIAQLTEFDLFGKPRLDRFKAAQENLAGKQGISDWIAKEQGQRVGWWSGHILDTSRDLTRARISEQKELISTMTKGVADIESSRELIRYGFALMAKDVMGEVDRGLSPETTQSVSALLQTRDTKVTWRITDEAREREWIATVKQAEQRLERKDTATGFVMAVGKIGSVIAATAIAGPAGLAWGLAAGFGAATAWNVGDKIYRAKVLKEDPGALLREGSKEAAWDAVSIVGTGLVFAKVLKPVLKFSAPERAMKEAAERLAKEGVKKAPKEVVLRAPRDVAREIGKGRVLSAQELAMKETPKVLKLGGERIRDLYAKEGVNWVQVEVMKRTTSITLPPDQTSEPEKKKPEALKALDEDPAKRQKLVDPTFHGDPAAKKPSDDLPDLALTKKPVGDESIPPPPPATTTTAPQSPAPVTGIEVTIPTNPVLLTEIEAKLAPHPNTDAYRTLTEVSSLLSQPSVRDVEGVRALQELRDDLKDFVIFPELVSALDKLLSGPSPFIAFLFAGPSGDDNRPPLPPPHKDAPPPPQPPPPSSPPPGGGSGGMPGPALVIASAPRGDSNGNGEQRGIGNAYDRAQAAAVEQSVSIPNLSASTLATGLSRAQQRANVMHDVLQRATAHQAEETRLIPTPQHHGVAATTAHAQSSELAAMAKRNTQVTEEALTVQQGVDEERLRRACSGDGVAAVPALKRNKPVEESMTEQVVSLVSDRKGERRSPGSVAEKVVAEGAVELKGAAPGEKVSEKDTPNAKQLSTAVTSSAQTEKRLAQEQGSTKELSLSKDGSSVAATISTKRSTVATENATVPTEIARKEATADTEMVASSDVEDSAVESTPTARARSPKKRDNARMRNLLLQQLMAQHANTVQREKILKALISLGISEVEYRKLLVQLGEMEVARKAEQAAATVKPVEPIAIAVEVPTMKVTGPESSAQRPEKPAVDPATTSRAALYKRLRQDASAARK